MREIYTQYLIEEDRLIFTIDNNRLVLKFEDWKSSKVGEITVATTTARVIKSEKATTVFSMSKLRKLLSYNSDRSCNRIRK